MSSVSNKYSPIKTLNRWIGYIKDGSKVFTKAVHQNVSFIYRTVVKETVAGAVDASAQAAAPAARHALQSVLATAHDVSIHGLDRTQNVVRHGIDACKDVSTESLHYVKTTTEKVIAIAIPSLIMLTGAGFFIANRIYSEDLGTGDAIGAAMVIYGVNQLNYLSAAQTRIAYPVQTQSKIAYPSPIPEADCQTPLPENVRLTREFPPARERVFTPPAHLPVATAAYQGKQDEIVRLQEAGFHLEERDPTGKTRV